MNNLKTLSLVAMVWIQIVTLALGASKPPSVDVPYQALPFSLTSDATTDSDHPAAIIRHIQNYGNNGVARPASTLYLSYDDKALYVIAQLQENEPGYPRALPRTSADDLTQDDAFQVVLGMADPADVNREVLEMGGYQGALNANVTAADFYYQFTVNAAGVSSRTYNETPLKRPLFDSIVSKTSDGWEVRMRIPFASIGLTDPAGKLIFANFFRFRPPAMTGWYLPGFGGYSGMPLGTMQFLPHEQGATGTPTVETEGAEVSPVQKEKAPPDGIHLKLEYYPLSGGIVGRVSHAAGALRTKCHAVLEVDGKSNGPQALTDSTESIFTASIPRGSQAGHEVRFTVTDAQGAVLKEEQQHLSGVKTPVWEGTSAGIDYLANKIPSPWKSPKVDHDQVTLVPNQIRFGSFGLFSSIRDDLGELLAGDSTIEVEQNHHPLIFKLAEKTVKKDGSWVVAQTTNLAGSVRLETRSSLDYDGFTEVKLRLAGVDPKSINRLAVRIPLDSAQARFTEKVLVQEVKALKGGDYETADGPLWVGDEDKGLRLSYDTDPFLSPPSRSRIRVVRKDKVAYLEFDLVDAAGQLLDADHIFRFFLQPTPTKPRLLEQEYSKMRMKWEEWASHQGEIDLSKTAELKKWTDDLAKQNLVGVVYTCQGLAANAADFQRYRSDLEIQPSWMFYRRAYNPGLNVPCFATDKRGPDGDRVLYGLQKLIQDAHIGGICDDGMSIAWPDANPMLPGGDGFPPDNEWDHVTDSLITGQRNFLKRLRGIFDEPGTPFTLIAHTGGSIDISTLSFFDGHMEGEQLARFRPGYHIPTSIFSIGYSGQPWGFRSSFWDKTWRRSQGFYWSYLYAYLFNADYFDTDDVYQVLKDFQDTKTNTFYPYWRPGPDVKLVSDHSVFSYVRNAGDALVTVGNMDYAQDSIGLDLRGLFPGKNIVVTNVLACEAVVPLEQGGIVHEVLPGWHGGVFRVEPFVETETASLSPDEDLDGNPKNWTLFGGLKGVRLQIDHDAFSLTSTAYQDEARVRFNTQDKAPVASGRVMVEHSGRLRIRLGDAAITYDSGWQSAGFVGGKLFQPPIVKGKPALVAFSVDQGLVQVSYNGEPLAQGLKLVDPTKKNFDLSTWAGDTLRVTPLGMSLRPNPIFEGKEGVAELVDIPPPAPFQIFSFQPQDWNAPAVDGITPAPVDVGPKKGIAITSKTGGEAAELSLSAQSFGQNASIALWIQHTGRFKVEVGNQGIFWDSSWQLSGDVAGWSEGRLFQPPITLDTPILLSIFIKNGLWTVMYGDRIVLRNGSFTELQKGGNVLKVSTWAGDSVSVSVEKLSSASSNPSSLVIVQPVL
jgi:hypothetical protein